MGIRGLTECPPWTRTEWQYAIDTFESGLVRHATGILGDVSRAQDVAVEVFLRLLQQETPPEGDHRRRWLYAVCRNRALDVSYKHPDGGSSKAFEVDIEGEARDLSRASAPTRLAVGVPAFGLRLRGDDDREHPSWAAIKELVRGSSERLVELRELVDIATQLD